MPPQGPPGLGAGRANWEGRNLNRNQIGAVEDKLQSAEFEYKLFVEAMTVRRSTIAPKLGTGTRSAYLAVRAVSPTLLKDRMLEPEIRAVRAIVADGTLLKTVQRDLSNTLAPIAPLGAAQ
jgi:hypothetical protein